MSKEDVSYTLSTINMPNITGVRELDETEYNKYIGYISEINRHSFDESLFKIVELNFDELELKINDYSNVENQKDYFRTNYLLLNINRLLLNFLSATRMYLDHTETKLKREYGNHSEELKIFTTETNEAFDENFAYRFLYKLRNFAQHCGLPVGSFQTHSEANENNEIETGLKLFLKKSELLGKFDAWGAVVKKELTNMEEEFDIIPLFKEKMLLLKKINESVNECIMKDISYMGVELLELMWETKKAGGIPCLIEAIGQDESSLKMNIAHFPFEAISKITGVKIEVSTPDGTSII